MADLIGFIGISLVSLITLLVARRWPAISKILFTALIIRILFLLLGHYLIFTLINESTNSTELFAVESEVMKSYP